MITATRDPNTVWDMAIAGNGTTSLAGDPIAPLQSYFVSTGARNVYGLADADLDALVAKVAVAMNTTERDDLLRQIQEKVADGAYMGFLGMRSPSVVAAPDWRGYEVSNANLWVDARTTAAR
jgi:ABC-type transport system substrate-binding protein